jgi:hypothetical protein
MMSESDVRMSGFSVEITGYGTQEPVSSHKQMNDISIKFGNKTEGDLLYQSKRCITKSVERVNHITISVDYYQNP